jgi:hypothetical protein
LIPFCKTPNGLKINPGLYTALNQQSLEFAFDVRLHIAYTRLELSSIFLHNAFCL